MSSRGVGVPNGPKIVLLASKRRHNVVSTLGAIAVPRLSFGSTPLGGYKALRSASIISWLRISPTILCGIKNHGGAVL